MLLYQPRLRHPQRAAAPQNLAEAEALVPGLNLNPVGADAADLAVDVELPSGSVLAIDDPALLRELTKGEAGHPLFDLAALGTGDDGLPPDLAHFAADGATARRGGRR